MAWTREATISGFNEFLETQQREVPDARLSLLLFDTTYQQRYTDVPVKDAELLTPKNYEPSGNTALYDAIGRSIREVESLEEEPDKVVFVIVTDGEENSSREFTQREIFDLIEWHKNENKGWSFTFLGANQDSYATSAALGIGANATMNYNQTQRGTQAAFFAVASATMDYAKGNTSEVAYDTDTRSKVEKTK
jgi:hypothetical protein